MKYQIDQLIISRLDDEITKIENGFRNYDICLSKFPKYPKRKILDLLFIPRGQYVIIDQKFNLEDLCIKFRFIGD